MTGWDVRPATNRVARKWRELRRDHPQAAQTALDYWADDPSAPHGLVVHPHAEIATRRWGGKVYEQRGFVVADVTAFFIVVDDLARVIITAIRPFLISPYV
jgi:hypothetical protein